MIIHWDLSAKCGFERSEKWYDHVAESVLENENYKLLWDFIVRTDHEIEARRPDLLFVDKREKSCQIIDVAIPDDSRVREKEDEKVEKYQDLTREVGRMWSSGNSTTESTRNGHINLTYTEISTVGDAKLEMR